MRILFILLALLLLITITKTEKSKSNLKSQSKKDDIIALVRQTARWSVAAQQDDTPLIALLHANYGAGYLWALKDIATDQEIENAAGVNVLELKKRVTDIQDQATRKVATACPKFVGDVDQYLLKVGGDR